MISPVEESEDEGKIHNRANELTGNTSWNYGDDVYTLYEVHVDLDLEGFEDTGRCRAIPRAFGYLILLPLSEGSGEDS